MFLKQYALLVLVLLPFALQAQTTDSSRTRRALKPDPAPVTSRQPNNPPLTNQEMSQIVNAVGSAGSPGIMVRTIDTRYEGLRGTPYFLNGWSKGQILLLGGKRYTDVPIKFDAFRQALILLRPTMGNDSIIIDRSTVSHFQLVSPDGQEYLFKRYPNVKTSDAAADGSYFLVLYEGKTALLKRVAKTFQGADYKQPYSNDIRYDSFQNSHAYYLLKPDQTLVKVRLTKKSLLDALSDKRDGLKAMADQLSFKNEGDAASLVEQYDKL